MRPARRMALALRWLIGYSRARPEKAMNERLANEILDRLKRRFRKEIAHTVVGYHVKIDEAQSRGLSIFEYAPKDRAASVMAELAEELELRGKPGRDGSPA